MFVLELVPSLKLAGRLYIRCQPTAWKTLLSEAAVNRQPDRATSSRLAAFKKGGHTGYWVCPGSPMGTTT